MSRRFAIQHHIGHGPDHFDLMIQDGEALATWQCGEDPALTNREISVRRLDDHRRDYLTYEGPVSDGRGQVRLADQGVCQVLSQEPDAWRVRFAGRRMKGIWRLDRLGRADDWTLTPDSPTPPLNGPGSVQARPRSGGSPPR